MMQRISSGSSFEADIGCSRTINDGDYLHVSGTTGFDYETMSLPEDIEAQAAQCLNNIENVPHAQNLDWQDIVRVHYIVPIRDDFQACWPLLATKFGAHPPAATMFVAELMDPTMKIEIEVTAKIRKQIRKLIRK
jgi:enamine deaminase RidA (YjgF/YER057c/UK114 family)